MDGFVDLFWGAFGDDVMDTFRYIFGTFFRTLFGTLGTLFGTLGMLFRTLFEKIFGMLI